MIAIVSSAESCIATAANLGGIGRARIVAFTAPVSTVRACATVAVLNPGTYTAALVDPSEAISGTPLVVADADSEGRDMVKLGSAAFPGRWAIAPGGAFPDDVAGDTTAASRVVIVFAGQQTLLVATSPVTMVDLTRILRDQPDLFGADSVERALVIASRTGTAPIAALQTDAGVFSEAEPAASSTVSPNAKSSSHFVVRKL